MLTHTCACVPPHVPSAQGCSEFVSTALTKDDFPVSYDGHLQHDHTHTHPQPPPKNKKRTSFDLCSLLVQPEPRDLSPCTLHGAPSTLHFAPSPHLVRSLAPCTLHPLRIWADPPPSGPKILRRLIDCFAHIARRMHASVFPGVCLVQLRHGVHVA